MRANVWLAWLLWLAGQGAALAQPAGAWRCGTPDPTPTELAALRRLAGSAARPTAGPVVYVPLRLYIVRRSDGTGGTDEATIYQTLAETNALFGQAGLQLYLCGGPQYLDKTAWYDFDSVDEAALTAAPNYNPNVLNVYYAHSVSVRGQLVGGYAYLNPLSSFRTVLMGENTTRVLSHELGHTFGLLHTFNGNDSPTAANRELVARTNCTTAGDLICDTPADPYGLPGATSADCAYTGTITDAQGQRFAPALRNGMSYWFCTYEYTAGQYARMQAANLSTQANLTCTSPTAVPTPGALAATGTGCLGRVALSWRLPPGSNPAVGYFVERAEAGGDFAAVAAVPAGATTYLDYTAPANAVVQYRLKPINAAAGFSNVATFTTSRQYCAAANRPPYCDAQGNGFNIGDISLSQSSTPVLQYSNATCLASSYLDHTAQPLTLLPGATYTYNVVLRQVGGVAYRQHLSIWLDLNQNGSLTDADELLLQSTSAQNTYTGTFTVPAGVAAGGGLLRIRSQSAADGAVADPCGLLTWGETHDYAVNFDPLALLAPAPLRVLPNPATAQVTVQPGGPGQPGADLLLLDATGREVRRQPVSSRATQLVLDLRGLPGGLYVVRYGSRAQRLVVQ